MNGATDLESFGNLDDYAQAVIFNGVNADTGQYLFPETGADALAAFVRSEGRNAQQDQALIARHRRDTDETLGLIYGAGDPRNLTDAGWALVAAHDVDPAIVEALSPLRNHRRTQVGDRYREFCDGQSGIRAGETKDDFLQRHGVALFDAVDPQELPYYVLLVGGAEEIPFEFQYDLGLHRAVGRVYFDTPEQYAQYADKVVAAEEHPSAAKRGRMHVFATQHDLATSLSAMRMVQPLVSELRRRSVLPVDVFENIGAAATKGDLTKVLLGSPVDVLFTATHGVGTSSAQQREIQGGLICQDWQRHVRTTARAIDPDVYFSAADVRSSDPVGAQVIVTFACFSAGTPRLTDFPDHPDPAASAEQAFIARLPQQLLANPSGGCLAFIGHVDRVWATSFIWENAQTQILPFSSLMHALLDGVPVGFALDAVAQRRAGVTNSLVRLLDQQKRAGRIVPDRTLAGLWLAQHDAQNFVILGDPAVRARHFASEVQ